ncbi:hypothetical protein CEXT_77051 [Caerostris extrusa]|uniref:Uncharacterized protein n=1 Tax=Caerostris extrusa TaxID=172846 RepID=A0AAV4MWL5_CAEEX|nr:hypothetical protein CEXT_77051 [Caerostris extrusa]
MLTKDIVKNEGRGYSQEVLELISGNGSSDKDTRLCSDRWASCWPLQIRRKNQEETGLLVFKEADLIKDGKSEELNLALRLMFPGTSHEKIKSKKKKQELQGHDHVLILCFLKTYPEKGLKEEICVDSESLRKESFKLDLCSLFEAVS